MNDQKKFITSIGALGELFGKEISAPTLKLYWGALQGFSDEQVQAAINLAVTSFKFMPKPMELIELMQESSEEQATGEWAKVMRHIRKGKPSSTIPAEVIEVLDRIGGWDYLRTLTYRELEFKGIAFGKIWGGKSGRGLIGRDPEKAKPDRLQIKYN